MEIWVSEARLINDLREGPPPSRSRRRRGYGANGRNAPVAALDLGTNNCRLLVARPRGDHFDVMDAFSRAVRLGEGVDGSNILSDAAQNRALKALRICAGKIRHHRVRDTRIVATEACRRALNSGEFIERVHAETGLSLDVIAPEEEARLAVAGCAPLVDPEAEQLLVFDIGGGSTELIWIDMSNTPPERRVALIRALAPSGSIETKAVRRAKARITDWISVPIGVTTLHERFADVPSDHERFAAMSWHFEQRLTPFGPYDPDDTSPLTKRLQVIGVSGTATTFGALHLDLPNYDRSQVDGLWLPGRQAGAIADRIVELGRRGRLDHPGIGARRADLVVSGAAILMTILRVWPVKRMRIADRGLREGMLYGLIRARRAANS
ncbi:Ppx/GppA family phosphatase [Rhodobacteraceae bacterium NNCM2]|nr:Ppx/GppA family phosphatase [Coraliihabitans acroporae]